VTPHRRREDGDVVGSDGEDGPSTGGEPTLLGVCTDCGRAYPTQADADRLRPIGTDGNCRCGNDEFEALNE
jgi:hypothetical protein